MEPPELDLIWIQFRSPKQVAESQFTELSPAASPGGFRRTLESGATAWNQNQASCCRRYALWPLGQMTLCTPYKLPADAHAAGPWTLPIWEHILFFLPEYLWSYLLLFHWSCMCYDPINTFGRIFSVVRYICNLIQQIHCNFVSWWHSK